MKPRNNLSSLLGHLSRTKSAGLIGASLLTSTHTAHSAPLLRAGAPSDTKRVSIAGTSQQAEIRFGAVRSSSGTASGATSQWTSLLSKTASGGLASALGGNLLSVVGGLGGLVSGIASLFGGSKKTLSALVPFQLPTSQNQVVQVSQSVSRSGSRIAISSEGVYGSMQQTSSAADKSSQGAGAYTYQSQQIAQAVKEALLNSSSLNDVIAEI